MLRMFYNMSGLGGLLLVVIVLMALVFAASRFDFILTSGKDKDGDYGGEEDSTYAFYASKRRRASSVKRVTFDI
ncbi:hypothetical protein CH63R_03498 [Colletotrichum higginsianum IMI 349063]|uniref:Uncharacterized protein n=5 Tax=Colletotrichum destructivum species complex TaxID=2707350 RepID=A0A1B7YS40_COLHI|nr:hypothetical protein CH63R_03498 [Colletotrichum higginsianum IMI 349063]OBR14772.1 hypothetical protein CH63R_03498 [Colletotrichum higginsianum IMI 349063]WQF76821.1 hypothetical protein CDEST_01835 [Colletotrichum destructivum]